MAAPDEEPSEDVPVVQNTIGILRDNDVNESTDKGVSESLDLLHRVGGSATDSVHGTNGHGCSSGGGEDEVQLASDVDDEELAERDSGKETEEGADKGDCDDATEILLGIVGEEAELIHGRKTGDEEAGKTACTSCGGLNDGVLLRTEIHTDIGDLGEDLGKDLNLQARGY